MIADFIRFVRGLYASDEFIPLHAPVFSEREKQLVADAIDSTFVSSVSDYVGKFEQALCEFTGAKYAVSTVNGTSALHLSLYAAGVDDSCEVITQALTFVATCNAIAYTGARPILLDVDADTLGLSPDAVECFLAENAQLIDGAAINKKTGRRIAACVPMHTFGHPMKIVELLSVCRKWNIAVIEDAAEALGSFVLNGESKQHCGTFGQMGVLSFNGNKIITTGAGGAVLTNDESLATHLRHLATTAKKPHPWCYEHDELGFNYRMPGLNAALGCAQMEMLPAFLKSKRDIAQRYQSWGGGVGVAVMKEPDNTQSNYWLNALVLDSAAERDKWLDETNKNGVMTRPVWELMSDLQWLQKYQPDALVNSKDYMVRLMNIPSGAKVVL